MLCIFHQHYKAHTSDVIQYAARFPGFQKSTNLLFGKFYSKFYNISNARLVYFSYLPAFSIVDRFIGFREMKNSAASDVSLPLNYNTTRHRTQYNNTTQHKTTENNTVQQGTTQLPQHNREQHSIHYEDKLGQTKLNLLVVNV